jgi:hypothetical protein
MTRLACYPRRIVPMGLLKNGLPMQAVNMRQSIIGTTPATRLNGRWTRLVAYDARPIRRAHVRTAHTVSRMETTTLKSFSQKRLVLGTVPKDVSKSQDNAR